MSRIESEETHPCNDDLCWLFASKASEYLGRSTRDGNDTRFSKAGIACAGGSRFLERPHDFSLVVGGPLYQLFRRSHLSGDALELFTGKLPRRCRRPQRIPALDRATSPHMRPGRVGRGIPYLPSGRPSFQGPGPVVIQKPFCNIFTEKERYIGGKNDTGWKERETRKPLCLLRNPVFMPVWQGFREGGIHICP
jgi:hypothetical protein